MIILVVKCQYRDERHFRVFGTLSLKILHKLSHWKLDLPFSTMCPTIQLHKGCWHA